MSLLVVGSIALDSVETPHGKVDDALGGSAVYCSVAASFFHPVQLVGVVGRDFPDQHVKLLESHDIDLSGLEVNEGETFRWSGRYSADLNHRDTLSVHLNVFGNFQPKVPDSYRESRFVFLANGAPMTQMSVLEQVERPEFVLADTMDLWIDTARDDLVELLRRVDGLVLNDEEAKQLTGESNLIRAGDQILEMGPKVVMIKKGEHGSFLFSPRMRFAIPAFPVDDVIDPTGAGDCFAGGLMGYLAGQGRWTNTELRKAMVYGTVVASCCVQGFSLDALRKTSREELDRRYREFIDFVTVEPSSTAS
ncbi:MAG: PfkB family carbohydrate kinase [Planctomycetota bacterium]